MIVSVWAAPAASEVVLPENIFPQLDSILKSAVQQSPRMLNRALDLEIAENSRIQARSNLLPSVNAGYSYVKSSDTTKYLYPTVNSNSNSTNTYSLTKTPYSATLSQPIFHWGVLRNLNQIGAIQQLIAQGQYQDGYRQLVQELRASYLRLILQKLALKRARFYLEYTNSQLKQQEDRLLKKEISDAQIFTARLASEQGQIALERTEFDFANAVASFTRLAGLAALPNEAIPDSVPAVVYDDAPIGQMLAGFLTQKDPPSIEASTLRQQLKIENLNYANAKKRLWPKINATVGMSQDQQNNLYGQGLNYSVASVYGGLAVNWAVFDGFYSGAMVRSTLAHRRQLENDYRQLTERLAQDAQTQVKLINFSARNMSIYDRLLVSINGYLVTVRDEFRRGVKSDAEVSQMQLNVYDAEINAITARSDYLTKVGDFLGTVVNDPVLANISAK